MENRKRIIELLTAVRYTTNDIEKVADEICLLFSVSLEDANKRLDEVDFFDLMQNYRIAMGNQENVINRFEAVKEWIRQNYA